MRGGIAWLKAAGGFSAPKGAGLKILRAVFNCSLLLALVLCAFPVPVVLGRVTFPPSAFPLLLALFSAPFLFEKGAIPSLRTLLPPTPVALFVLWSLFAFSMAVSHGGNFFSALQKFVDLFLMLFLGGALFKIAFFLKAGRYCVSGLAIALIIVLVRSTSQYLAVESVADHKVCAGFSSAAELGGFLALTVPFFAAGVIALRAPALRIISGLLLTLGVFVILDGASYWGIFGGLVTGAALALVPAPRPSRNNHILAPEVQVLPRKPGRLSVFSFLVVLMVAVLWQNGVMPFLARENEAAHFSSMSFFNSETHKVQLRMAAWQTAACMGLANSITGAGLGQFEVFRESYSETVPFAERNAAPNEMNQYLLWLAEGGLPMLFLGVALFCIPFVKRNALLPHDPVDMASGGVGPELVRTGCALSVGAFAFASIYHPLASCAELLLPLSFILVAASRFRPRELPWGETQR